MDELFGKLLTGGSAATVLGFLGYLLLQVLDRTGKINSDYQDLLKNSHEEAKAERDRRIECETEAKLKDKEIANLKRQLGKKK